jgi:hypothetical protein
MSFITMTLIHMSTMSFDIIEHFTISYTPKFNNKFNDNIEICNMLLALSICINKLWGINDMKIFSLFLPCHGAFQNPWNPKKKTHILCKENFCDMLLSLQGNHKPHCLRKKVNIWGCKTYCATLPSHPTPIPPKSKFIFKVPSYVLLLWFCFFYKPKIIETTHFN